MSADVLDDYTWAGRSGHRHRVAIINHLAINSFNEVAEARLRHWLACDVLPREPTLGFQLLSRLKAIGAQRLQWSELEVR